MNWLLLRDAFDTIARQKDEAHADGQYAAKITWAV
jgi:hypothetical protein